MVFYFMVIQNLNTWQGIQSGITTNKVTSDDNTNPEMSKNPKIIKNQINFYGICLLGGRVKVMVVCFLKDRPGVF